MLRQLLKYCNRCSLLRRIQRLMSSAHLPPAARRNLQLNAILQQASHAIGTRQANSSAESLIQKYCTVNYRFSVFSGGWQYDRDDFRSRERSVWQAIGRVKLLTIVSSPALDRFNERTIVCTVFVLLRTERINAWFIAAVCWNLRPLWPSCPVCCTEAIDI